MSLSPRAYAPFFIALLCVIAPTGAFAQAPTGGTAFEEEPPPPVMLEPGLWTGLEVPGDKAVLLEDGTAAAPANAPDQVKQAIWAANSLQELPYRYGGGHNLKFDVAKGADCSGTVSFALKAAGLLKTPLDSGSFMKWGAQGQGRLDHRLHEPGPRLRGDRRPPARHQRRRQHPLGTRQGHHRERVRERPPLAPLRAPRRGLQEAPRAVLLAPSFNG